MKYLTLIFNNEQFTVKIKDETYLELIEGMHFIRLK